MLLRTKKSLIVFVMICAVLFATVTTALTQSVGKAYAYNTEQLEGATVIDVYNQDTKKFKEEGLNKLAENAGYSDLNAMISAVTEEGVALSPEFTDTVVELGVDRTDGGSALKWVPVYLSSSADGDAVLTLWLATDIYTSSWSDGTYSTNATKTFNDNTIYSNTYDGSFIRHILNGETGWTTDWGTGSNQSNANENIGTMVSDFNGGGELSSYVVTPSKVSWQTGTGSNRMKNDPGWAGNASLTEKYPCDWVNDNVWLPSMYEVFDKDITADSTTVSLSFDGGLWDINASICSVNNNCSWLRTGHPTSSSNSYLLGGACNYLNSSVNAHYGVRPAIHLNLKTAKQNTDHVHVWESADNDGWVVTAPATCVSKGIEERKCSAANCPLTDSKETREIEIDPTAHTFELVIVSATAEYSAFDLFDTQTAEVYTHCSACNQNIEKLSASDLTVTYNNGNCLHADDTRVSLSATVGGQTLTEDYSVNVKPYEITLSDAEVYRWTLGADNGSLLRDAYIEESNGTVLYYDPETGAAEGRMKVTRSVVRYRGDDTGLNIVLNGGEIADLFEGTGKRSNIAYSGTTAVGTVGKYTAIATLTLNDTLNYRYAGEITVADSRGMTIVISENGTKAVITKVWYVATIDNGLLMPDGGEYSVNGWTFGEDIATAVPKLEHGDENFDLNNILQDDKRISFGLFTDIDRTEQIGETFCRYNFADYINKSMPSGNYVLRVSVAEVNDAEGLAYQAFTRTFTFTVQKGTLEVIDTLNGETFEHVYNGNVQLFGSEYNPAVSLKYVSASDRIGIWKNSGYDKFYGASYLTFRLARWQAEGGAGYGFVSLTQLENTLDAKQAPREADTYTVQYKISALNYADYGGSTSFTVTIAKQTVALPQNVTETLIKEYVYQIPQNALYYIEGNAKFTQEGTHTVTLKLADAENYAWEVGENVDGDTATVTVTLIMHEHVYGEWTVDKTATCTEAGARSSKCTLCGHEVQEEITASGHNLTHVEYKEATADTAGNIEYWICGDCGEYFSDEGGETVITDKSSVEIPMLTPETPSTTDPHEKKSYVWICAIIIPLVVIVGVTLGIWLYKKRKN